MFDSVQIWYLCSKIKILATFWFNISLFWWKYSSNTILTGYLAFEITWYGHAQTSYARSLCIAVFSSVLLPVNSDYICKRYFTGANEIMQLPPYHWSNINKTRKWWPTQNKANKTIYMCLLVSHLMILCNCFFSFVWLRYLNTGGMYMLLHGLFFRFQRRFYV